MWEDTEVSDSKSPSHFIRSLQEEQCDGLKLTPTVHHSQVLPHRSGNGSTHSLTTTVRLNVHQSRVSGVCFQLFKFRWASTSHTRPPQHWISHRESQHSSSHTTLRHQDEAWASEPLNEWVNLMFSGSLTHTVTHSSVWKESSSAILNQLRFLAPLTSPHLSDSVSPISLSLRKNLKRAGREENYKSAHWNTRDLQADTPHISLCQERLKGR